MKKHKMKKSRKILIAGLAITSIIAIPISVVACGGAVTLPEATQKDVDNAQAALTTAISKNDITLNQEAKSLYVNLVQNYNIQNYLNGLPNLNNDMHYVFTIISSDASAGSVTASILVYGGINSNAYSKTPSTLTISGFQQVPAPAADQAQVNAAQTNLNNAFRSGKVLLNAAGFFVFANTINNTNVSSYITGLPTLSDNMQYNYQFNSANQLKGTISVTISVSAGSITNDSSVTANAHALYGFMIPVAVDNLNNIIVTINALLSAKPSTVKVNKEGESIEAQNVTNANVNSYLDGLGILNKNVSYNFTVTKNTIAGNNSIQLQISLSSGSTITSKSSDVVTISGFKANSLTTQVEVDAAQTTLEAAITKNTVKVNSTEASKIYANLVQNYNIQNYIDGLPVLTGGMQYIFTNVRSDSSGNVTANITIYANALSNVFAKTPSSITLAGFKTNAPNATLAEVNAAQNTLNTALQSKTIVLNNFGAYVLANTISNSNIQQYLTGLPTLSNNMVYDYNVTPITAADETAGTIIVTISVSAGSGADIIKSTVASVSYSITGFKIPPKTTTTIAISNKTTVLNDK